MVAHRSTTPRPTLTAPKKPVKQEKRFPNEAARREASRKFRATFKGPSYLYVSNLAGSVTALDVERVFRPNTVRSVRIHPYDGPMSGWNKASASSNEVIDKKYAVVLFVNNIWAYKGLRERGRLLKGHPLKITPCFSETPGFKEIVLTLSDNQTEDTATRANTPQPTEIIDLDA